MTDFYVKLIGVMIGVFALAMVGGGVAMVLEWLENFDRTNIDHSKTVVHVVITLLIFIGLILGASA